jgi:hypothetical protein
MTPMVTKITTDDSDADDERLNEEEDEENEEIEMGHRQVR